MISRENNKYVQNYIEKLNKSGKFDDLTVKNIYGHLIHLLYWAGSTSFAEVYKIEQRFPRYLIGALRRDGKQKPLSYNYISHVTISAKKFFIYLGDISTKFRKVSNSDFLSEFDITRADRKQLPSPKIPLFVSTEFAVMLANSPVETLKEKRTRAQACWLFLSAQRIGAAATTPLAAIDLQKQKVQQLSIFGVETKNQKEGVTELLPKCDQLLPLYSVVENWVKFLGEQPQVPKYYFSRIDESGLNLAKDNTTPIDLDGSNFRTDLSEWCTKLGLEAPNPHAFRHGFAHFALAICHNVGDIQVVSQNLLHSDIAVTLKIYFQFLSDHNGNLLAQMYERQRGRGKNLSTNISDPELNYLKKYALLSDDHRNIIDQLIDNLVQDDEK